MKIYKKILLFAACLLGVVSCSKDKGNYDYTEFDKVVIENFEKNYSAIAPGFLEINPTIKHNPKDKLSYVWLLYTVNESYSEIIPDTIGLEQNLKYDVSSLSTGKYRIDYKIMNLMNGHEVSANTIVAITTKYSTGFYFAKENIAGDSEIDLWIDQNTVVKDIITSKNGKPMRGKAVSLSLYPEYSYVDVSTGVYAANQFVNLVTDDEVGMFRTDDMKLIRDYKDLFYAAAPTNEKPFMLISNYFAVSYISNKGFYSNYQAPTVGLSSAGQFGVPAYIDENMYEISPYVCSLPIGHILFDSKNGRFICVDYQGALYVVGEKDGKPSPNNIQHDLQYMGWTTVGSKDILYAIFKDKSSADKYLYSSLNAEDLTNGINAFEDVVTINPASKLYSATRYETNKRQSQIIYFLNEGKLYSYDCVTNAEELMSIDGLPADEEISYFNTIYYQVDKVIANNFDYLVVATHKNGQYTVRMYDMVGGKPFGSAKMTFKGEGKVAKVLYANSNQNLGSRGKFSLNY